MEINKRDATAKRFFSSACVWAMQEWGADFRLLDLGCPYDCWKGFCCRR